MKYKAVVIGVGAAKNSQGTKGGGHQIGYSHAEMFQRSPKCELVAGVDINEANLAAFKDRFGVKQGFIDVGQMLKEIKPDVVSIGTYVGLHRKFIEQCARGGVKAILCEKPFLTSPADIVPVRAVAAETGVKIVVAHIRRYRPAFERVRELIRIGAIGTPQLFLSSLANWDLSEMGSHWLDLIRFFNQDNPVKWVLGQTRVGNIKGYGHRMEDHAVAHFGFENGVRGLLEAGESGMNGDANSGFVLLGSAGVIRVRNENIVTLETLTGSTTEDFTGRFPARWDSIGITAPRAEWACLWDMLLHDLIIWTEGGPVPTVGLESVIATLEIAHGAYLSSLVGDRVDLPISGELSKIDKWPVDAIADRRGI